MHSKSSQRRPGASKRKLGKRGREWETYEEVAAYILKQAGKRFGLSDVEGKQAVRGWCSGTEWKIDAKGIQEVDGALWIIECRRYTTSRISQERMAAVAYRIQDTGAAGGITVSPHPLQKGAAKVAKANKIEHVELDPSSTRGQWIAKIKGTMNFGVTVTERLCLRDTTDAVVETRRAI